MNTVPGIPAQPRGFPNQPPARRRLRWSLMGLALALSLMFAAQRVWAADAEICEDFTPNSRPCTAMEEYGYCLENAMDSYDDCRAGENWWGWLKCTVAYDVDFWACALTLPIELVKE
jgi:hypothetical protein